MINKGLLFLAHSALGWSAMSGAAQGRIRVEHEIQAVFAEESPTAGADATSFIKEGEAHDAVHE